MQWKCVIHTYVCMFITTNITHETETENYYIKTETEIISVAYKTIWIDNNNVVTHYYVA